MEEHVYRLLLEAAGKEYIAFEEPMREHTTFRVGGNAEVFIAPDSIDKICRILDICREYRLPCHVIGNGSNLLVGDRGVRGVVLQIYKNFSDMSVQDTCIWVQAGALLAKTAAFAAEHGLTGLEFASGIPGTVGGAVTMNAGAYGGEMKDVISRVRVLDPEGKLRTFSVEELQLGYRASLIQKQGCLVVEAELALTRGEPEKIYGRMEELKAARKEKQPIEFASAGSTFKRPEGYFAGKLIMDAGLRGYSVGDAQVSEKHCGFVINRGEATAAQVMELIEHIQAEVLLKFGVKLEMEVKRLGDF
ncbi:MAG: UDP-N-acetylmuramate dehydrogenase [Lachnospiraceae bacterium]|nr:UDP-N-acetylmuramate dehydrogenase [Lachnospiraceae bacterium]